MRSGDALASKSCRISQFQRRIGINTEIEHAVDDAIDDEAAFGSC